MTLSGSSVNTVRHCSFRDAGSPAALGYRFPAEWEPHAATWLAWPHNPATWPGKFEPIPAVWQELVRTLAEFEPVHILAGGEAVWREAESLVGDLPDVTLHDIPTNDVWARDHGPMFLAGPPGSAAGAGRLGVQRLGRQVSALRSRQRGAAAGGRADRPAAIRRRASFSKGGPSTATAPARS